MEYNLAFALKVRFWLVNKVYKSLNVLHAYFIIAKTVLVATPFVPFVPQDDKTFPQF